jgi:hypothetical protein
VVIGAPPFGTNFSPTVWRPPRGRIHMTTRPKIERLRNPRERVTRQLRCNGILLRSRQTEFFAVKLHISPIFQLLNLAKQSEVAGNVRISK